MSRPALARGGLVRPGVVKVPFYIDLTLTTLAFKKLNARLALSVGAGKRPGPLRDKLLLTRYEISVAQHLERDRRKPRHND